MRMTSRLMLIMVLWWSSTLMTKSKPLQPPCTDASSINLLALALAETSRFPAGVEVVKEEGVYGYKFLSESKIFGVAASEILPKCDYFPQEFSLVLTFKREIPRNENEYILSLIAEDRHTVLFGVSLQRDTIHLDFIHRASEKRHAASFPDVRMANGEWHTAMLVVTRNKVKFSVDCLNPTEKKLSVSFPRKLNTRNTRFHIASRRRTRNRFTGMLRQVQLLPGTDASVHLCQNPLPEAGSALFLPERKHHNHLVHFEDTTNNVPSSCGSQNQGQLMYRKDNGILEMCEGLKWMRLATTNQRLDYVKDSGNLITKSKTHDIEIFRINGEGLFLASANQGRDKNMDSTIYKWDDRSQVFTSFQNISTNVARDWEYFSIENEHFLAVANRGPNENSAQVNSAIYRWNRRRKKFTVLQYIPTFAARSWESFAIDGKHYIAVANHASPTTGHRQKSWIYVWEPDHRAFVNFQPIDTIGGYDFEYFQINDKHYLAVANSYDGVKTKLDSVIYQWILSNFVALQYVETFGATDWEYFSISGKHFLAVANYFDYTPDRYTYAIDSDIYEYVPDFRSFKKIQSIQTHGALDIEFFTVGQDAYLIASSSDDDETDQLTTVIYRWQGMEHFVPVHNFSTSPCSDWESFQGDDGNYYLVAANVKSRTSKVDKMVKFSKSLRQERGCTLQSIANRAVSVLRPQQAFGVHSHIRLLFHACCIHFLDFIFHSIYILFLFFSHSLLFFYLPHFCSYYCFIQHINRSSSQHRKTRVILFGSLIRLFRSIHQ